MHCSSPSILLRIPFRRGTRNRSRQRYKRWLQDVPDTTREGSITLRVPFEFPSKGTPKFPSKGIRREFEGNSRPTAPADGLPPERTRARHSTPSPCTRGTLPGRRLPAPPAGSSPERSSGSGRHSNMNNYMYKKGHILHVTGLHEWVARFHQREMHTGKSSGDTRAENL